MATQVFDAGPFSRIVSKGRPTSWAVGLPFAIIIVILIAAFAYFASKATSYSEQLGVAQRGLAAQQQNLDAAQKRLTQAENELGIAKSPGVTTVTLLSPEKAAPAKAPSKKDSPTKDSSGEVAPAPWGSAVWGEQGGRAFVLLRVYGLATPAPGKAYLAFYETADGKPMLLGAVDPGPAGSAFVEGKDLPPLAEGKRIFVTLASEGSKAPEGAPVMEAKLVPPKTAAADQALPAGKPAPEKQD